MKGIENLCAQRRVNYEPSSCKGSHRVACGCGRDIYRNNEEIKKGGQVNTRAAPQGVAGGTLPPQGRGAREMAIFMDCIAVTLEAMLWLYVILELLIRCMLGVG